MEGCDGAADTITRLTFSGKNTCAIGLDGA
jgi:hypothetical protein